MGLHQLKSPAGARRNRRRRGQGDAAGQGSYAGRGFKGQKKRGSVSPHFEGGQLKLVQRLPYMRGFTNVFRVEYVGINLDRLREFGAGSEISPESLIERGLVNKPGMPVKILGNGEAPQGIKVAAHAFSESAKTKIEAAGGTATVLPGPATQAAPARMKGHIDERARKALVKSKAEAAEKAEATEKVKASRKAEAAQKAEGAQEPEGEEAPAAAGEAAPRSGKGRKARQ